MKLDMVGLVVSDMEAACLFYERLGLKVAGEIDENYTELVNDGVRISLNSKKMIAGIYGFEPNEIGHQIELAFLLDSPQAVDTLCEKMRGFGYSLFKEPWDAFWGQRYAIIHDCEGNLISLFAALA